ncbi:MAG: hypothetical protein KA275_09370 [Chitinophagaceae bacterium]|nr:hypothetical protein [Chitinophagaceae bacterium]
MKNILLTFATIILFATLFTSCNTYYSINSATKLSHLSANPFMKKIATSVFKNITTSLIDKGLTSFKGKPQLMMPLSALATSASSANALKAMLGSTYGIDAQKIESNYSKWSTIKDVISFVGSNARKVDFNSYSNKLIKL